MQDDKWFEVAKTNALETFSAICQRALLQAILARSQQNLEFMEKIMANESMYGEIVDGLMAEIYEGEGNAAGMSFCDNRIRQSLVTVWVGSLGDCCSWHRRHSCRAEEGRNGL